MAVTDRIAQIDQQHRHALGWLFDFVAGRGAHQQQQQVGVLGARNKYLLPADDIVVAVTHGAGLDARGVGTAARLGDAESLQAQRARGDIGQVFSLLRLVAVTQQAAHDVHLCVTGGAVGAAALNLFEHGAGGGQVHAGAVVFFRDQYRKIAGVGKRLHELERVSLVAILVAPVGTGVVSAKPRDRVSDLGM
jgi:hypothetical protein